MSSVKRITVSGFELIQELVEFLKKDEEVKEGKTAFTLTQANLHQDWNYWNCAKYQEYLRRVLYTLASLGYLEIVKRSGHNIAYRCLPGTIQFLEKRIKVVCAQE